MSEKIKSYTIAELADYSHSEAHGNLELKISGIADADKAGCNQLAIAYNKHFVDALHSGRASAALLDRESDWQQLGLEACLCSSRPRFVLARISCLFAEFDWPLEGISGNAIISPLARIGKDSSIGHYSVIGEGVEIGPGAIIGNNVTIGRNSRIGRDCFIHDGVRIGRKIIIGDYFIAESNTVIGCSGFSYETEEEGAIEEVKQTFGVHSSRRQGKYTKINSVGGVVIGDDVEIGAGCCIDRGTLSNTRIGTGTKLDNLVHIAHNVVIGTDCLLCGQVGIAGSSVVGDRSILAGKTGIKDHIRVGEDVIAAGASQIFSNVADGQRVMGDPATTMKRSIENYKAYRRMSRMVERVSILEERVSSLEDSG